MSQNNLTHALLVLYTAALGFFLGMLFGILPIPAPGHTIAGYIIGFLVSGLISFELIKKWQAPAKTKIIASFVLLAIIAVISVRLQAIDLMLSKMQFTLMSR